MNDLVLSVHIGNKTKILPINQRSNCNCNVDKVDKFISDCGIEAKPSNSSLLMFRALDIIKKHFRFHLKLVSIDILFESPKC